MANNKAPEAQAEPTIEELKAQLVAKEQEAEGAKTAQDAAEKAAKAAEDALAAEKSKAKDAPETTKPKKAKPKMVKVKLFKDNNKYKDDVFVSVNGKRWQIRRGVEVEVPDFVKEVLDHSAEQDMNTANMIAMLEADAKENGIT